MCVSVHVGYSNIHLDIQYVSFAIFPFNAFLLSLLLLLVYVTWLLLSDSCSIEMTSTSDIDQKRSDKDAWGFHTRLLVHTKNTSKTKESAYSPHKTSEYLLLDYLPCLYFFLHHADYSRHATWVPHPVLCYKFIQCSLLSVCEDLIKRHCTFKFWKLWHQINQCSEW